MSVFFSKKCGKSDVMTTIFVPSGTRKGCSLDDTLVSMNMPLYSIIRKLLAIHAGENKMAQSSEGLKPLHKNTVSWFEFLFDTTGDLLKKHLGDVSAG